MKKKAKRIKAEVAQHSSQRYEEDARTLNRVFPLHDPPPLGTIQDKALLVLAIFEPIR